MDISPVRQYLQGKLEKVEALMDSALKSDVRLLDATNSRFREHPGKMVRAMLALLAAPNSCTMPPCCMTMWWTAPPSAGACLRWPACWAADRPC